MENEQHVDLPAVGTGLTQKQEAFAQAFVETGNGTEAHRRAGYGANMSSKTRNEAASRLLANGKVRARVTELQNRGLERHDVTVDRIIKEYAKLAFSDIRMLFDEHGNLKLPYVLPDDIAGAISNLEITTVQKGKGAVVIRIGKKPATCGHHGSEGSLHICSSTTMKGVIGYIGAVGWYLPLRQRPWRNHVGMAGKYHQRSP